MLSVHFLTVLFLCIFLYYSCAITITNWSQYRDIENQRLTTNIGYLSANSDIDCAVECANIPQCMSYSYHAGNNTCLLYSMPFTTETTGTVAEDGWTSYNSMCDNGSKALDYFYKPNLQMCYHLETNTAIATEAMSICSISGRMLRIDSNEKQAHIVEFLSSRDSESVYIGGTSANLDNIFLYEDGTPMTLFFWSTGKPNNRTAIRMKKNAHFKWVNVHGTSPTFFMCEIVV